ncbi:MAG: BMP family ABC transporter substrate-binding protein [Alphaproteobacteria bacterium]|nr:BMP family ABC transporter substrate-binding protein [Alphaproteobacteria bacterium]
MMRRTFGRAALVASALLAGFGPAMAQDVAPAIVFDMGGKFDKSFNEAAYTGAERFKRETNIQYREFEITNEGQREQALRNMARRGATVVVAVGFSQRSAVERVAPEFPQVKFSIIDSVIDMPNVNSTLFREHEGSFLVGVAAGLATRSNRVGFVGGMDIPLIRSFGCGFIQGVRSVNPQIEVFQNMTGTTPAAFRDPTRGGELARSQFDRGADVIYAAAGATGLGVLQAAKDAGRLGIGVDSNQNHLHPGSVLTSMLKRVDVAVFNAFKSAQDGTWRPGTTVLGLKEEGVGWALDEHNRRLISADMETRINQARQQIIAGTIQVIDSRTLEGGNCPIR